MDNIMPQISSLIFNILLSDDKFFRRSLLHLRQERYVGHTPSYGNNRSTQNRRLSGVFSRIASSTGPNLNRSRYSKFRRRPDGCRVRFLGTTLKRNPKLFFIGNSTCISRVQLVRQPSTPRRTRGSYIPNCEIFIL